MSGEAAPIVGREAEVEAVGAALAHLLDGTAGMLVVTGEPGIGKTLLMSHLAAMATERGCIVLSGRAAELERDLPFGPVVAALDDYLMSLGQAELWELTPETTQQLGLIFPSFAHDGPPGLQAERFLAYRAVRRLRGYV